MAKSYQCLLVFVFDALEHVSPMRWLMGRIGIPEAQPNTSSRYAVLAILFMALDKETPTWIPTAWIDAGHVFMAARGSCPYWLWLRSRMVSDVVPRSCGLKEVPLA